MDSLFKYSVVAILMTTATKLAEGFRETDCPPCQCNTTLHSMKCSELSYIPRPLREINSVTIDGGAFGEFGRSKLYNLTMAKITELTLKRCQMSILSPRTIFSSLTQLEILRLNRTILIPEYLRLAFYGLRTTKIKELYLDDVDLAPLPCQFFDGLKASKIKLISIRRNSIRKLRFAHQSNTFNGVPHLETLILSENQITTIEDDTFYGLKSLKHLFLDWNKIKKLEPCSFHTPSLTTLSIANNRFDFSTLAETEKLFQKLSKLEVLNISGNNLKDVTSDNLILFFKSLSSLTVLKLENTGLTKLPSGIFNGLKELREIYLERNFLKTWNPQTFIGLGKLETVFLNKNKIQTVSPEQINSLTNKSLTVHINLSNNPFSCDCQLEFFVEWLRITDVAMDYPGFYTCTSPFELEATRLSDFVINKTRCHDISKGAKKEMCYPCKCLDVGREMVCRYPGLTQIPEAPSSVQKVSIDGVTFKSLNASHFGNLRRESIRSFVLVDSFIEHARKGVFRDFTGLETFDLSHTVISPGDLNTILNSVPVGKLKRLIIDDVNLENLPRKTFGAIEHNHINELSLSGNYIESLPEGDAIFRNLPMMVSLNLSHNMLSSIHNRSFSGLNCLRKLDLRANSLTSLEFLSDISLTITHLWLSNNKLQFGNPSTQSPLRRLTALNVLDLSSNNFSNTDFSLSNPFQHMKFLEHLDLSNTGIRTLPRGFFLVHPQLEKLNLAHNGITYIDPNFFSQLINVQSINLRDNEIRTIQLEAIQQLRQSSIQVLNLDRNPFKCSCEAKHFISWINTTQIHIEKQNEDYLCAEPSEMSGTSLFDVDLTPCWMLPSTKASDLPSYMTLGVVCGIFFVCVALIVICICVRRKELWLYTIRCKARLRSQRITPFRHEDFSRPA